MVYADSMLARPDDIGPVLARLRQTEGILTQVPTRVRRGYSLWPAGLPKNALVNLSGLPGGGKSEAALRFALETQAPRLAWVEAQLSAYPPAFQALGLNLENILFAANRLR